MEVQYVRKCSTCSIRLQPMENLVKKHYRGTSNEENQNGYFHDLETDCEKDVYLQIILAPFMEKYLKLSFF